MCTMKWKLSLSWACRGLSPEAQVSRIAFEVWVDIYIYIMCVYTLNPKA